MITEVTLHWKKGSVFTKKPMLILYISILFAVILGISHFCHREIPKSDF